MAGEVFLNYRNGDQPEAAALIERDLSSRFGSAHVFRASKSIRPSANFAEALRAGVRNCRVLVAVIGKRWLVDVPGSDDVETPASTDDWTQWEIREAFRCGKHVLPVLVGRTTEKLPLSGVPDWVARLAQCQYLRFDSRNAEADLEQVARAVAELVPELGGPATDSAEPAKGTVFQARDHVHQQTGGIGSIGTIVTHPTGPVHTGSGNQYNGPHPFGGQQDRG